MSTASKDAAGWQAAYTIAGAGEKTITFKTENKFVDADTRVTITTPAASAPVLSVDNNTATLPMGTASSGKYTVSKAITGKVNVSTAGWIASGDHIVSDSNVTLGIVNESTLKVGTTTISSGATIIPSDSAQTITISEGYNSARTLTIGATDSGTAGEITSGTATVDTLSYAYNSTDDNFKISGSADVTAPTVVTPGYISSTKGTKNINENGATVDTTVNKIAIQANLSGTGTKVPSITKNANTNIPQAGTATTTKPSSGYYVAVSSAANTGTVQATAAVVDAGYGTTTSGQYTTTPSSSLTVGAEASSVTYVPITQATFANTATGGTTYADISSTAPILISGDYLYINAGYTPDSKISLAKLVPDATGENAPANYILAGYTAFTNDGTLIIGTMQTYDGTYTVT